MLVIWITLVRMPQATFLLEKIGQYVKKWPLVHLSNLHGTCMSKVAYYSTWQAKIICISVTALWSMWRSFDIPIGIPLPGSSQNSGQHLDDYIAAAFQFLHGYLHNPLPDQDIYI